MEIKSKERTIKSLRGPIIIMAASVVVIVILSFVGIYFVKTKSDNNKIFNLFIERRDYHFNRLGGDSSVEHYTLGKEYQRLAEEFNDNKLSLSHSPVNVITNNSDTLVKGTTDKNLDTIKMMFANIGKQRAYGEASIKYERLSYDYGIKYYQTGNEKYRRLANTYDALKVKFAKLAYAVKIKP